MRFPKNLAMYFWVFLPATVVSTMAYAGIFGQAHVAPEWRLGWNPIPWLIVTAPWLLPTVVAVPALHWLGSRLIRRQSAGTVRTVLIFAAPLLFLLILFALWGESYLAPESGIPVVAGAALYGAMLRIPRKTST